MKKTTEAASDPVDTGAARQRPGGRSARVREAVREATRELLAEEGFSAITLPAVARRAGVNKTTLYRWWSTPVDLIREAQTELDDLALPEIDTGSWECDVEAFVESRVRLISNPTAVGILRAVIAMGQPDATLREWIDAIWNPRRSEWRSPVERAIARGELAPTAREVPLLELVAGPLMLAQLATQSPLTPRQTRSLAATIAAGVRALHGTGVAASE